MVSCKEISDKDELAIICKRLFSTDAYEVNLLMDHKPASEYDNIRVFNASEMRAATKQEIDAAMTEWETKNNYKLR